MRKGGYVLDSARNALVSTKMLTWEASDVAGVMCLHELGLPTIIFQRPFDMLERRASNSSEHPRNVVTNEIHFGGIGMTLKSESSASL